MLNSRVTRLRTVARAASRDAALRALPVIAMLLISASDEKKSKSGFAVWIALAAVFIALGASAGTRLTKGSRTTKGKADGGSDALAASQGPAESHDGNHHNGHGDHGVSDGADGGGGDGGGD